MDYLEKDITRAYESEGIEAELIKYVENENKKDKLIRRAFESLELEYREQEPLKPSVEKAPKLELKTFPQNLK